MSKRPEPMLRTVEALEILNKVFPGIVAKTLRNYVEKGLIKKAKTLGGLLFFDRAEIEKIAKEGLK